MTEEAGKRVVESSLRLNKRKEHRRLNTVANLLSSAEEKGADETFLKSWNAYKVEAAATLEYRRRHQDEELAWTKSRRPSRSKSRRTRLWTSSLELTSKTQRRRKSTQTSAQVEQ